MTDNIFARVHSLARPDQGQELPILISENPSRDYYFPVSALEVAEALTALPAGHGNGITHIWLRRSDWGASGKPASLAEFVCGGGVRAIILFPWRRDGRMTLGRARPPAKATDLFVRYGAELVQQKGMWQVQFDTENLRRFYIEHLLCHEVGHHVDWYHRHWSRANVRQCEEFADQYAVTWGRALLAKVEGSAQSIPSDPALLGADTVSRI